MSLDLSKTSPADIVQTMRSLPRRFREALSLAIDRPNVMVAQTIGAGHFIQLEVPDQVNAMIERFLAVTAVHA